MVELTTFHIDNPRGWIKNIEDFLNYISLQFTNGLRLFHYIWKTHKKYGMKSSY